MKINRVTPILGQGNICASWVFVKVETDQGIVGYGEGTRHAGPVIAEAIRWLAPHVVGKNPFNVEALYTTMFKATHYTWGSIFSCAITAIETALWDIMGKATGKPVYELLGGKVWDNVRLYSHIGGGSQIIRMNVDDGAIASDDFGAIKERAQDLVSRGFTCVKTFQAGRYKITENNSAKLGDFWPNMHMHRSDVQATARKVEFIREQVGDEVEITFDAHGLNAVSALRLAKALEPFDLLWYEEPVHPFNLSALKQLACSDLDTDRNERAASRFYRIRRGDRYRRGRRGHGRCSMVRRRVANQKNRRNRRSQILARHLAQLQQPIGIRHQRTHRYDAAKLSEHGIHGSRRALAR